MTTLDEDARSVLKATTASRDCRWWSVPRIAANTGVAEPNVWAIVARLRAAGYIVPRFGELTEQTEYGITTTGEAALANQQLGMAL